MHVLPMQPRARCGERYPFLILSQVKLERQWYSRRRRFEPGEVERIVVLAADQMDDPIARLAHGQVPPLFGTARAHREPVPVGRFQFAAGSVVTHQTPYEPRLALRRKGHV
jgi:hypothetical protein